MTAAGAGRYAERLLPLPRVLNDPSLQANASDIVQGLRLTGHFLHAHLLDAPGAEKRLQARERLLERVAQGR